MQNKSSKNCVQSPTHLHSQWFVAVPLRMRISQLIIGLGVMLFIALSGLMYSTASAQITPPTPLPIPTEMELVVVAGGRGAELYRADGTLIRRIAAGERLIASKRSGDNEWLLVTTPDGTEGWAARGSLIIFERIALPTEDIVIEPIQHQLNLGMSKAMMV